MTRRTRTRAADRSATSVAPRTSWVPRVDPGPRRAISFVPPGDLGLVEPHPDSGTRVCAVLGSSQVPVDIGWFVHDVRAVEGRQRDVVALPARQEPRGPAWHRCPGTPGVDHHCARSPGAPSWRRGRCSCTAPGEMNHLAVLRLPDLYADLGDA